MHATDIIVQSASESTIAKQGSGGLFLSAFQNLVDFCG